LAIRKIAGDIQEINQNLIPHESRFTLDEQYLLDLELIL
jgi:hypothetical protein